LRFSLIVGLFGVPIFMFGTVRERKAQVGLKKALGAKKFQEVFKKYFFESSFLCIIGGMIGYDCCFYYGLPRLQIFVLNSF